MSRNTRFDLPIAVQALKLIAAPGCESFTYPAYPCYQNGRTSDAKYGAERACNACIAHAALNAIGVSLVARADR